LLVKPDFSADDYERLKALREEADRRYNDALTALDAATLKRPDFPHPPPGPDEHQITPLNQSWTVVHGLPYERYTGWRRRAAQFVWDLVGPLFHHQQDFNSALVDHINRNLPIQRATREAIDSSLGALRAHLDAFLSFQNRLILYLQQITLYVDTKDRREELAQSISGIASGLNAVTDEMLKRWESMVARERRYELRVAELFEAHAATKDSMATAAAELAQFRTSLALFQQTTATLKREMERLVPTPHSPLPTPHAPLPPHSLPLDSQKYVGFEDAFRGSREEIRRRQETYLTVFDDASDVLDVGCGRGEFLELLRERGIGARGLDLNHEMVELCRGRGFDVSEGDAVGYLTTLADGALGGLTAFQVVEHFDPTYLLHFLDLAYHKLRPGSRVVLETINPASWFAFFSSYIRDITHVRPLHPATLEFLLLASGFQQVTIRYSAPTPAEQKLLPVQPIEGLPALDPIVRALNVNADRLNQLLFGDMDYAVVGVRL
jgi:SAM-dependent methyltransferase